MTDHHNPTGWDDVHALSGAYAVDALDPGERARFEAHLTQCADCRAEVEGLLEAAAFLSGADEVAPPAHVRDQVLAGIGTVRPLPPQADDGPASPPTDNVRRGPWAALGSRMPMLVAAAVVLLVAIAGLALRPWADDEPEQRLTVAERVLAAADATRLVKRFPDGAQATLVVSRTEGRAVILTEDMAAAPRGKDYQLWLQTPAGELLAAGLMPDAGDATVLLEGDATRSTGVGITIEPDGGSKKPSTEPIAFFTIES